MLLARFPSTSPISGDGRSLWRSFSGTLRMNSWTTGANVASQFCCIRLQEENVQSAGARLCLLFLKLHRTKSLLASCFLPSKPDYELAADISSGWGRGGAFHKRSYMKD